MTCTILAVDPGVNHFAFSVQRQTPAGDFKVLARGFLHFTIRTLTSPVALGNEVQQFRDALASLCTDFNVTHVIAERYMLRRGSGGSAIECINIMLGVMLCHDIPMKIIPAAQWKNAVARSGNDLEAWYAEGKAERLTPHEIDACMIGRWCANLLTEQPQNFTSPLPNLLALPRTDLGVKYKPPKKRKKRTSR